LTQTRISLLDPPETQIAERMMSRGEVVWSFKFNAVSRDTQPSGRDFAFVCEYLNDPNLIPRAKTVPFRVISRAQKEKGAGATNGGEAALQQAEETRAAAESEQTGENENAAEGSVEAA